MAGKFRKDDVVNYVTSKGEQIHEWDGSVITYEDEDPPFGAGYYHFEHPKWGSGMLRHDLLVLVKRVRFEEGDRVVANSGKGFSALAAGDRGTVVRAVEEEDGATSYNYDSPQFLTVNWDDHGEHGVFSSRVDYLEPTHEVDYTREGAKVTIHAIRDIKDPAAPTVAELNKGINITPFVDNIQFGTFPKFGEWEEPEVSRTETLRSVYEDLHEAKALLDSALEGIERLEADDAP